MGWGHVANLSARANKRGGIDLVDLSRLLAAEGGQVRASRLSRRTAHADGAHSPRGGRSLRGRLGQTAPDGGPVGTDHVHLPHSSRPYRARSRRRRETELFPVLRRCPEFGDRKRTARFRAKNSRTCATRASGGAHIFSTKTRIHLDVLFPTTELHKSQLQFVGRFHPCSTNTSSMGLREGSCDRTQ